MNERIPMDDIARVLKRKQRYSIDSVSSSSEESFDSDNKLKAAHKKAIRGVSKTALKSQAKADLKENKKTQIIKNDEKEKKSELTHKVKPLANRIPEVENQVNDINRRNESYDSDYILFGSSTSDDNSSSDDNYDSGEEVSEGSTSDQSYDSDKKAKDNNKKKKDTQGIKKDEIRVEPMRKSRRLATQTQNVENQVFQGSKSDQSYDSDEKVFDSRTSDQSSDSDEKEISLGSRNNKPKVRERGKSNAVKSAGVLSSYEKMAGERKREAMEFLQSLKINAVKADLNAFVNSNKVQSNDTDNKSRKQAELQSHNLFEKKAKARHKKKKFNVISLEPMRKSSRLATQTQNVENQPGCEHKWSFKDTFAMENNMYKEYLNNVCIEIPNQTKPLSYNKSTFESLNLEPSNEFCLRGNNFTSLTWHSSTRPLILVAGNRQGYIAVMNIDTDTYFFKPHKAMVSHVQFNQYYPVQLFSTSVDGKLLCGDMVKHIFSEVYNAKVTCNYFDILSQTTCLVAQQNGKVAMVDNRIWRRRATQFTCHTNSIKTVNLHCTNQNYFVTAENNRSIRLWDLRRIQEHPVAEVNFEKTLNSAFFSPVTGNSILATTDCEVSCFDSTHLTGDLKLLHKKKFSDFHSSRARASWVPNSDEIFVTGSVYKSNNKIEVYDKNMELHHLIMKSKSTCNCTFINAFHPYIPGFATTYTLGKQGHILVYM